MQTTVDSMYQAVSEIQKLPTSAILCQLAEEASELAQAALKLARILDGVNPTPIHRDDAIDHLNEEIADIQVCVTCLNGFIDRSAIDSIQITKLLRWSERLRESGGTNV